MATLGNTYMSLLDVYQSNDRFGNVLPVIEGLHTLNPVMEDGVFVECNNNFEHTRALRTNLPEPAWGMLYKGTPYSKSEKQQVKDATGSIELQCGVDDRLLKDLSSENAAKIREAEAEPTLEAMAQMAQSAFFYGNIASNPQGIQGLAPRYSTLTGGGPSDYIVDGGGIGADNTSIWFVTWGQQQTAWLYPKGTAMGVQREDMGRVPVTDATGTYYVETERFRQHLGVTVGDYRFNSRVANVDVSDALAGNVDIIKLMIRANYKMQKRRNANVKNGGMISPGKTVIYMRREIKEALHLDSSNKRTGDNFIRLRQGEQQGEEVMSFLGMPIHECDGLLINETRVV